MSERAQPSFRARILLERVQSPLIVRVQRARVHESDVRLVCPERYKVLSGLVEQLLFHNKGSCPGNSECSSKRANANA